MTVAPPVAAPPLRRDSDFRRYWLARIVSVGGSMVTYVVLPVLVYQLTASPVWSALVAAAEALPYLLFGLVAGAVADRRNRRAIMIGTDIASALVLLSVPAAHLFDRLTPVHVLVAGFAVHSLFVFFDAANFGALPVLAGRDRLAAATATVVGTTTVLELLVPTVMAGLIAVSSPAPLLALDAVSFIGSALLIRAIAKPLQHKRDARAGADVRLRSEIREGIRFLFGHPMVRVQTLIGIVACIAFGSFTGQLVPWADTTLRLDTDDDWRVGLLFTAWGAGGLVAATVYPRLARVIGEVWVTLITVPLGAGIGLGLAAAGNWAVATALVALWAVPSTMLILNTITVRAKVTPDRLQSRVNTTSRMLTFGLGTPIGALSGGVVANTFAPRHALLVCVAALTVATAIAWLSPLFRSRHDPALVAAPE
jgi:MFS family permease